MADTLSERLRKLADRCGRVSIWWRNRRFGDQGLRENGEAVVAALDDAEALMQFAAAELDRREAIVAAAEAWAANLRHRRKVYNQSAANTVEADNALLALLPAATLKG